MHLFQIWKWSIHGCSKKKGHAPSIPRINHMIDTGQESLEEENRATIEYNLGSFLPT
jgi:hypothetical protein